MADRRDPQTGDYTYIGAFVFGKEAGQILRKADETWSACAERLIAVRERIRTNEEIIAECKSALERVERFLAERAASPRGDKREGATARAVRVKCS